MNHTLSASLIFTLIGVTNAHAQDESTKLKASDYFYDEEATYVGCLYDHYYKALKIFNSELKEYLAGGDEPRHEVPNDKLEFRYFLRELSLNCLEERQISAQALGSRLFGKDDLTGHELMEIGEKIEDRAISYISFKAN